VSVAALLVLAGALAGAAWLGASWGRGGAEPVPAAESARVTVTGPAAPTSSAEPGGGPTGVPAAPDPGTRTDARPGAPQAPDAAPVGPATGDPATQDLDGWAAVVQELYRHRAGAYAAADRAMLSRVYAPGSPLLQRDGDQVAALADAGHSVTGFEPRVVRVTAVAADDGRVVVHLVDEVPGHRVVTAGAPPGAAVREEVGRGAAEVRMTLLPAGDGWLIDDAELIHHAELSG
jgi:hypothetical protein